MNTLSNIWLHPKTSIAGVLIAGVTIAGVLSQQGITLGAAGKGTVVALIAALCTGLLGLLSKDPGTITVPAPAAAPTPINSTVKLGVWMLIVLLFQLPLLTGCSPIKAAQDIVNWMPALQSAVTSVDATISILDPVDAPIFAAATVGFDAGSNLLVAQAKAYLANPSATVLAQLQTQIVTFQQQVNAGLLKVAGIKNPASQQKVLADIAGIGTILNAVLALVVSISGKPAVAQMAADSPIKLAQVEPLMIQRRETDIVAEHYRIDRVDAHVLVVNTESELARAGF